MQRLLSRSTILLALVSCVFFVAACDSGGSNSEGNSGGGGNDGSTVTATDENSFTLSFPASSSSSASAKAGQTYSGFAFQYSGTDSQGNEVFAIYFSSANVFDANAPTTGPEVAGVLFLEGNQNPGSGTYSVGSVDNTNQNFAGIIVEGFDNPENVGTRTLQLFTGGEIEITNSGGNVIVSSFNNVTANEIVIDASTDPNSLQSTGNVNVNLSGTIDPADGLTTFVQSSTFNFSYSSSAN